jgi:transcription initiation factor TFIIIB Brf1 subunit/transcription initiation factor TFIIB
MNCSIRKCLENYNEHLLTDYDGTCVCIQCGFVFEDRLIDQTPEYRSFEPEKCHYQTENENESINNNINSFISNICEKINVKEDCVLHSKLIYNENKEFYKNQTLLALACIYLACKLNKYDTDMIEYETIGNFHNFPKSKLLKVVYQLETNLKSKNNAKNIRLNEENVDNEYYHKFYEVFVRLKNIIDLSHSDYKEILRVLSEMKNDSFFSNRNLKGCFAVALLRNENIHAKLKCNQTMYLKIQQKILLTIGVSLKTYSSLKKSYECYF